MPPDVVVLGAGYAGAGVVDRLEETLDADEADLTWVSEDDHHFLLHEAHRLIREPDLREEIAIPVEEIESPETAFVEGRVEEVHRDQRAVELADGSGVEYDYLVDCLGSRTAFYGIDGMEEHALTLKSLEDALAIHEQVVEAAREASPDDPARIVVGGAGLSGIQSAGEIAALRDERGLPIEVVLVEAMDDVFPGRSNEFQGALRDRLEARDVEVRTGHTITRADDEAVRFEARDDLSYDVLLWTGGVTGVEEFEDEDAEDGGAVNGGAGGDGRGGPADRLETEEHRVAVDATLRSDDERVFALGDAARVEQDGGSPPPSTAQAAWDAAEVAGTNVARALRDLPLDRWRYRDMGTLVSVGDAVVAHDVAHVPVSTFGGEPAKLLKKAVGARWIGEVASWPRAARAWPAL